MQPNKPSPAKTRGGYPGNLIGAHQQIKGTKGMTGIGKAPSDKTSVYVKNSKGNLEHIENMKRKIQVEADEKDFNPLRDGELDSEEELDAMPCPPKLPTKRATRPCS